MVTPVTARGQETRARLLAAAEKVFGERNAHLTSTTETGHTDVTADRVDLSFKPSEKDSTLDRALATGHAVVNSKPIPKPVMPSGLATVWT